MISVLVIGFPIRILLRAKEEGEGDEHGFMVNYEGLARSKEHWVSNASIMSDRGDLSQVTVGTLLEVYWDGNDLFYRGTVTNHVLTDGQPHTYEIHYQDGDIQVHDMAKETFRIVEDDEA